MKAASRIIQKYAIFASLWILFSDKAVEFFSSNIGQMAMFSIIKGLTFVLVTSLLLFYWIRDEIKEKNRIIEKLDGEIEVREQLIRELHHRIKNNLQVVIGLLNLEAKDGHSVQDLKEKITSKLLSMMAVFNIVYDMRDMEKISLAKVIEEYKRISIRNIVNLEINSELKYSIETITSFLLLLDSIIEGLLGESYSESISIFIQREGEIRIHVTGSNRQRCIDEIAADELIRIMLSSVQGEMKTEEGEIIIKIRENKI